ncbi:MAG: Rrf2 family transcriptional regulator [Thiothrix sp.]|uniref:Rrf2 family transcriptional regulator n=1 Tax=Thiothrix sp. TaxID=1032 RepID=UPI0026160FA5|nr:Rrf2 family transcriptional regulator [Thiothrix sp.]MDD5394448.1 Rrf2 family transcriptional regulator [Thiothrix sp.]
MKLSTQGQHAIMAMLALAIHDDEGALRLGDIAKQQGISLSYLEQIFAKLRNEGLVEGIRGPGGGYCLVLAADEITLAEIVSAAEDEAEEPCVTGSAEQQAILGMWEDLSSQFHEFLNGISLASLMAGHKLPRKVYRMGETASLIARMFPARMPMSTPGMAHHAAM